jgi:hypothetical protein
MLDAGKVGVQSWGVPRACAFERFSIQHPAPSIQHRASSIEHRASSIQQKNAAEAAFVMSEIDRPIRPAGF